MRNMRPVWGWWILGLAITAGIGVYWGLGLGEYMKARRYLANLTGIEREETAEKFYGRREDNVYGGIFAGAYFGRLWLWGESGLSGFSPDTGTAYSYFSMCSPENRAKLSQDIFPLSSTKEVTGEFPLWRGKTKAGQYVRLEVGGVAAVGAVREAHGFDWWVFARLPVEQQCGG